MKALLKLSLVFILFAAFTLNYSCTKEIAFDDQPELINLLTYTNNEVNEDLVIEEIIDDLLEDLDQYEFKKSTCPAITTERPTDENFPKIVTKDFGEGCVNQWGVERSGKIIITVWGNWLKEGSKRDVVFENYTHRGRSVEGEKHIICNGLNEDGLYVHAIDGDLTIIRPDSIIVSRELHKKRIMLCGANNPDIPNEWLISGHANVEKSNGVKYHVNKQDIYRIQGCKWPQLGFRVLHITAAETEGLKQNHKITVDYSYFEEESDCDRLALRKVDDDEATVITLK